ncbi:dihydrofolate reductase-like domain-containing protein [Kockovaella imperatae]|uniref:2,5-diamino-6-ribosylamino-4(3H)-pyrimidinone 5'-phosphate reductase n=1 Tax=Kockovaella imperatae TaxID=4999 RepID=A0A1Y1UU55_9TREE|nr:dihydrofolate reductase-like domain-containing protein [Kockovaella imperatae]ORX41084.1 dihydrofolate reductase-like domain-containing protein [Kockovaella imperatae]
MSVLTLHNPHRMVSPPAILDLISPRGESSRPYVTLTWAQSLDAKIAGEGGKRVILSGPESMLMTHWMRSRHDSILVGINTLLLDDPRLQINLLPDDPSLSSPQPLILDPQLRFPTTARILAAWRDSQGRSRRVRQPWILCGDHVASARQKEMADAGARVVPVPLSHGRINPNDLPDILTRLNLSSVMIEGGSAILSSFLHAPSRSDGTPLVDNVVITVAPMFIGKGVGVIPEGQGDSMPELQTVHTETLGKDAVMVCRIV